MYRFQYTREELGLWGDRCRLLAAGVCWACALLAAPVAGQQPPAPAPAAPAPAAAEMAQIVARIRADLEAFRFVSGGRPAQSAPWRVGAAAPRHAFYTAQTLFRKVSRLASEVIGTELKAPPASSPGVVTVDAALNVARSAHEVLLGLLGRVGVKPVPIPQLPVGPTVADTLVEMVAVNRQLNAMLVHEYRPAEIYELVERAVRHLAALTGESYPQAPRLVGNFTVTGVYRKLLDCYELAREAEAARDLVTLGLDLRAERRRERLEPSDAHDLAQLLLADIAFMSAGASGDALPYQRPSYIHPAHVHRLASVLETQLASLL